MQNFTYHTHNHEQDFDGHQRARQTRFRTRDRPLLAHDFAKQSVVCYTLCRRCRENAVAAGEGKGI